MAKVWLIDAGELERFLAAWHQELRDAGVSTAEACARACHVREFLDARAAAPLQIGVPKVPEPEVDIVKRPEGDHAA